MKLLKPVEGLLRELPRKLLNQGRTATTIAEVTSDTGSLPWPINLALPIIYREDKEVEKVQEVFRVPVDKDEESV